MKYQKKRQESMCVAALKNQKGFLKSDNQIQTKIFTGQLESVHTQECLFFRYETQPLPISGKITINQKGKPKLTNFFRYHWTKALFRKTVLVP